MSLNRNAVFLMMNIFLIFLYQYILSAPTHARPEHLCDQFLLLRGQRHLLIDLRENLMVAGDIQSLRALAKTGWGNKW